MNHPKPDAAPSQTQGELSSSGGDRVLVSRHSPFNMIVLTEDAQGLRTLCFGTDSAFQSVVKVGDPERLELPYARLLPACLAFANESRRILVVGLGGGTLPAFFHCKFPEMVIDVVEIDPDVLDIAKSHCGFCEDERMRVHVEDGRDYIEACEARYDVIVLDSFGAESIPPHLVTAEFLCAVRRALTSEGVVVANVWGPAINPLYDSMLLTYREAFADVYVLDVPKPGTKLFVALQRKETVTRSGLIARAREVASRAGFRYDLGAEIAGFRHSDEERRRGGEVLKD